MEPVTIALLYDFDKTLCTKDMQEYTFIPQLQMEAAEFWEKSNALSQEKRMDKILAYMYVMLREADYHNVPVTKSSFGNAGRHIEYYPGVLEWFERINEYGRTLGIHVEHYIISSGLKEIIEGSELGQKNVFKEIFACEYYYDSNGRAVWPLNVVNYTGKTQYLFRINKGVLDMSNDKDLNANTPMAKRAVPFRNMIYFGDGLTDVPCMKLVHSNGGCSIAVYGVNSESAKETAEGLLRDDRVDYCEEANYMENGSLDQLVKQVMQQMVLHHRLILHSLDQRDALQRSDRKGGM